MSAQIRQEPAAYYHILEQTQKANMDIPHLSLTDMAANCQMIP